MSNESPKQTRLNDFSHRLKMEGEEQLCDCVNELKLGLSSNNKYDLFKNKETSLWKRKVPESAALAMTEQYINYLVVAYSTPAIS